MPTNLEQGEEIRFVTRFRTATGALAEPSSATITLTYRSSGLSTTTIVPLTRDGDFWTGTWDSDGADLGSVPWTAASDVVASAESGVIRIIDKISHTVAAQTSQRFAANRARWLTNSDLTKNQIMAKSGHRAWVRMNQLRIYVQNSRNSPVNIHNDFQGEVGLGATATVSASIEYPAGTFTRVLFNGSTAATIPNIEIMISDVVDLSATIPPGGIFWVYQFWQNANGVLFNNWQDTATYGDAVQTAVSGLTDQTMTGSVVDNTGWSFPPAAIIAESPLISLGIVGDSIGYGNAGPPGELAPFVANTGVIAETLASAIPIQNLSQCGARAYTGSDRYWITTGQPRRTLVQYCTDIVCQMCVNDLAGAGTGGSRTAAELDGDLTALFTVLQTTYGLPATASIIQTTSTPYTTSVDNWKSVLGQTPITFSPGFATRRVDFNTLVRDLEITDSFYEIAGALESSLNSSLWAVGGSLNLLPDSNDFSTGSWVTVAASVANGFADPFGGSAAWRLTENGGAGPHYTANIAQVSGAPGSYVFSVFAKSTNRRIELRVADSGGANFAYVVFDLIGGVVGTSGTGGAGVSLASSSTIFYGSSWYRCIAGFTTTITLANSFLVLDNGVGNAALSQNYVGDGVSGAFITDAQLEQGTTATAYTPGMPIALTDDGLHPNDTGYQRVVDSGAVTIP